MPSIEEVLNVNVCETTAGLYQHFREGRVCKTSLFVITWTGVGVEENIVDVEGRGRGELMV